MRYLWTVPMREIMCGGLRAQAKVQDAKRHVRFLPFVKKPAVRGLCELVATSAGGILEILHDGERDLLYAPGEAVQLMAGSYSCIVTLPCAQGAPSLLAPGLQKPSPNESKYNRWEKII